MKKILSVIVLVVYLMNLGCHSMRDIPVSEAQRKNDGIVAVIYPSGKIFEFNENRGTINSHTKTIEGTTKDGTSLSIPIDSTLYVRVQRINAVNTSLLTIAILIPVLVGAIIIAWALSDSMNCPYVYSFDGQHYIFDAQPLGGAFSRGLERADLSRLEHLRPVDGKYRLLVRNEETSETQYLDEARLIVADHPAGTRVVPDSTGSLHVIGDVVTASSVTDENGNDIHRFFDASDEVAWQTKMPIDESWRALPPRHELTFEFPRPRDATSADLVVKAGTANWGSEMIHQLIALRGDTIDEWQESMDAGGTALHDWNAFNTREELYSLRLDVLVGDRWVPRAWIPGGASLATEERVIPIDFSGVRGDAVKMRVCPPRGFWTLDFLGLEFEHHLSPAVTLVPLHRAITHDHADVTSLLSTVDGQRYVMPRVGDEVTMEFAAPEMQTAGNRTVFLDMRGYYHAHIDKTEPEQKSLIDELARDNGRVVEYAMDLYMKWRMDLLSQR
jgi:hypothetical protein